MRKPTIWGSEQVRHKPDCTVTEDGWRFEILDLESRGIVLCSENKSADQLRSDNFYFFQLENRIFIGVD